MSYDIQSGGDLTLARSSYIGLDTGLGLTSHIAALPAGLYTQGVTSFKLSNVKIKRPDGTWISVLQGIPGDQGIKGFDGIPGLDGDDGSDSYIPGPQGSIGLQGIQGDQGIQGIQGFNGLSGDDGEDSYIPGPIGMPGVKGDTGDTGAQGIQGIQGDRGFQGFNGLDGDDGEDAIPTGMLKDHNQLDNLQGGVTSEYYHLTSVEYAGLISRSQAMARIQMRF